MPIIDLPHIIKPKQEFARLARLKAASPIFDDIPLPDITDTNTYEMISIVGGLRRVLREACDQKIDELSQPQGFDADIKDEKRYRRENFLNIQQIKEFKATQLGGWTVTRAGFVLGLGTVSLVLGVIGLGVLLQVGLSTGFATILLGSAILAFIGSIPFASTLGVIAGIGLLIASGYVALFPLRELIKPGVYRQFKLRTHENVLFAMRPTLWRKIIENSPTLQRFRDYRALKRDGFYKSLWKAMESDTWREALNLVNWVLSPLEFTRNLIDDLLNQFTERKAPRYGRRKDPSTEKNANASGRIATFLKGLNHFISLLLTWPLSILKGLGNIVYVILRYGAGLVFLASSILVIPVWFVPPFIYGIISGVIKNFMKRVLGLDLGDFFKRGYWKIVPELIGLSIFLGIIFFLGGWLGVPILPILITVTGLLVLEVFLKIAGSAYFGPTIWRDSWIFKWFVSDMALENSLCVVAIVFLGAWLGLPLLPIAGIVLATFIVSSILFFGPKFFTRLNENGNGFRGTIRNLKNDCTDIAFERDIAAIKRLLGIGTAQEQEADGPENRGRDDHFGPGNGGPFFPGDDGQGPDNGPGPGGDGHDDGDSMQLLARNAGGNTTGD